MPIKEDILLVEHCKKGNQSAMTQLVNTYSSSVATICQNMLQDSQLAKDVVQETFIRFFHKIHQFKGESSLKTYISRIAINLSLNELKKTKKSQQRLISLDQLKEISGFEMENPILSNSDDMNNLYFALNQLKPREKSLVILRMIEGYNIKETANLLNIKEGTVMSGLSRALSKLKTLIQKINE